MKRGFFVGVFVVLLLSIFISSCKDNKCNISENGTCDTATNNNNTIYIPTKNDLKLLGTFVMSVDLTSGKPDIEIQPIGIPEDVTPEEIQHYKTMMESLYNDITVTNVSNSFYSGNFGDCGSPDNGYVAANVTIKNNTLSSRGIAYDMLTPIYFQVTDIWEPANPNATEFDIITCLNTDTEQLTITGIDNGSSYIGDGWDLSNLVGSDHVLSGDDPQNPGNGEVSSQFNMRFYLSPTFDPYTQTFKMSFNVWGHINDTNNPLYPVPAPEVQTIYDSQHNVLPDQTRTSDSQIIVEGRIVFSAGTNPDYKEFSLVFSEGTDVVPGSASVFDNEPGPNNDPDILGFSATINLALNQLNTFDIRVRRDSGNNAAISDPTTVSITHDSGPPILVSTNPADGAIDVPTNQILTADFDEALDAATVNNTNITLSPSSPGLLELVNNGKTVRFTPDANQPLANATNYTWSFSAGVKDLAGNSISPFNVNFTTVQAGTQDNTPPTVNSVTPPNNSTDVPVSTTIDITFSEAIDQNTVPGGILIRDSATLTQVNGSFSYSQNNTVVTFTPAAELSYGTEYLVTVTTSVKDLAGNAIQTEYNSTFTTQYPGQLDTTPPTVTNVIPQDTATNVPVGQNVTITFSETIDSSTVDGTTVYLLDLSTNNKVSSTLNTVDNQVTIDPVNNLSYNTQYQVVVKSAVTDLAGNQMTSDFTSTFTTESQPDTTPPSVTSTSPADGEIGVSPYTDIVIYFNEPMDPSTIHTGTIYVHQVKQQQNVVCNQTPIAGTVTLLSDQKTAKWVSNTKPIPTDPNCDQGLAPRLRLTVSSNVSDTSGNLMGTSYTAFFILLDDTTSPTVTGISPPDGSTNVSPTASITVNFSEAIDATTINNTNVVLTDTTLNQVHNTFLSLSPDNTVLTINPQGDMNLGHNYSLNLTTGIKDQAGNALDLANSVAIPSTFTVANSYDTTPPTMVSCVWGPDDGFGLLPIAQPTVTFSESLDLSTVNSSNLWIDDGVNTISSNISTNDQNGQTVAVINPNTYLSLGSTYYAKITTGLKDLAGNRLDQTYVCQATITSQTDTTQPQINKNNPSTPNTKIAKKSKDLNNPPYTFQVTQTTVTIHFTERIDPDTLDGNIMWLRKVYPGNNVYTTYTDVGISSISVSQNGMDVTVTAAVNQLPANYAYAITVNESVKDAYGNPLMVQGPYSLGSSKTEFLTFKTW